MNPGKNVSEKDLNEVGMMNFKAIEVNVIFKECKENNLFCSILPTTKVMQYI